MAQRILVMGLPGAGKTTLAKELVQKITELGHTVTYYNADEVREKYNDWDFSQDGRVRQAARMRSLADEAATDFVLCDFVAPLREMREIIFEPDWVIWVDTIREGRYADTNAMFEEPTNYDFRITEKDASKWSDYIVPFIVENRRRPTFDWKKETVQMLGRWQPWHDGHRALFERAIAKTGQVIIQVRTCQGWNDSNPFNFNDVVKFIRRDLDPLYQGMYVVHCRSCTMQ